MHPRTTAQFVLSTPVIALALAAVLFAGATHNANACPGCLPQFERVSFVGMLMEYDASKDEASKRRRPASPNFLLVLEGRQGVPLVVNTRNERALERAHANVGQYVHVDGLRDFGSRNVEVTSLSATEPETFEWVGHFQNVDVAANEDGDDDSSPRHKLLFTCESSERQRVVVNADELGSFSVDGEEEPTRFKVLAHYVLHEERVALHITSVEQQPEGEVEEGDNDGDDGRTHPRRPEPAGPCC